MKYTKLVFQERQNREQARAAERRHAEIFALEGKRQPHPFVLEVAGERVVIVGGDAFRSGDVWDIRHWVSA